MCVLSIYKPKGQLGHPEVVFVSKYFTSVQRKEYETCSRLFWPRCQFSWLAGIVSYIFANLDLFPVLTSLYPTGNTVFVLRLMAGRHNNNIASHFEVSYMKLLIQNIEEKFHRLYNKCEGILTSLRADVSCFFRCTLFPQTTMESGVARMLLSYPLCFFSLFRTPQSVLWIELPGPWRLAERQKQ